jgi:DegT/DnrJ/EryC1/StrS aminotransferase family
MIPYSRQDVSEEDIQAVCEVLRSDFLTQVPTIEAFERAFAGRHQVAHAMAVNNSSAGFRLRAWPLTWVPARMSGRVRTVLSHRQVAALHCGATIDFVGIDSRTRNMSVEAPQFSEQNETVFRNRYPHRDFAFLYTREGVVIGNNVWIGSGARIRGSVCIDSTATVGAGSVDTNAGCLQ